MLATENTAVGTGRKGALTDTASQQIGRVQGRVIGSDRFVKKKHWGVADRQEGGGAAGTNM